MAHECVGMAATQSASRSGRPSLVENVVLVVAVLVLLEQHSRLPEANFFAVIVCGLAIVCVGVTYIARLAITACRGNLSPAAAMSWLVLPAAIVVLHSSAITHWPASIRFYFSKSSFEELVTQAQAGNKPADFPRRVGLYWIESIHDYDFNYETGEGTIGFVTGVAVLDECGIEYDHNNPPTSHYLTTRIAPNWYLTEW